MISYSKTNCIIDLHDYILEMCTRCIIAGFLRILGPIMLFLYKRFVPYLSPCLVAQYFCKIQARWLSRVARPLFYIRETSIAVWVYMHVIHVLMDFNHNYT